MWLKLILTLVLGAVPLGVAAAQERVPNAVLESVVKLFPGTRAADVQPSPIPGLYEVAWGLRVLYISADGTYLVQGDVLHIEDRINVTEQRRRKSRLGSVAAMGEETMIVFPARSPRHTITVFTDVDCPYCARLHVEVPRLNELGVRVRYAAFPRGGIPSANYRKMVSVWCAEDTRRAMTDAKAGRPVKPAECPNAVAEHFELGRALGVTGTPTIMLDSGELVPGYVPYRELLRALEQGG